MSHSTEARHENCRRFSSRRAPQQTDACAHFGRPNKVRTQRQQQHFSPRGVVGYGVQIIFIFNIYKDVTLHNSVRRRRRLRAQTQTSAVKPEPPSRNPVYFFQSARTHTHTPHKIQSKSKVCTATRAAKLCSIRRVHQQKGTHTRTCTHTHTHSHTYMNFVESALKCAENLRLLHSKPRRQFRTVYASRSRVTKHSRYMYVSRLVANATASHTRTTVSDDVPISTGWWLAGCRSASRTRIATTNRLKHARSILGARSWRRRAYERTHERTTVRWRAKRDVMFYVALECARGARDADATMLWRDCTSVSTREHGQRVFAWC